MSSDKPSVAILIVNWNTGKLLTRCLESIAEIIDAQPISQVIIVDNDSADDSFTKAKEAVSDERFVFVASSTNLGFATANNLAASKINDPNAHVLLLNPDTEVGDTDFSDLLDELRTETVGIVGPRLQNPDGSHQASVRSFPTIMNFVWLFFKLHRVLPGVHHWQRYMQTTFDYYQPQGVDQVMGAAFLVRRSVWDALEGMDGGFFVWFEEVDFCKRAEQRGFTIRYTPVTTVTHYGGVSFNQLVGWRRTKPWVISSLRYIQKHEPVWLPLFVVLAPFALLLSLPAATVHSVVRARNKKDL